MLSTVVIAIRPALSREFDCCFPRFVAANDPFWPATDVERQSLAKAITVSTNTKSAM